MTKERSMATFKVGDRVSVASSTEFKLYDQRLPVGFWSRVIPEPTTGCWIWIGRTQSNGRNGIFDIDVGDGTGRRTMYAHRITAHVAFSGDAISGLTIDHKCVTPMCCNPSHLEAVTHQVNCARIVERGRFCRRGHERTDDSTGWRTNGAYTQRYCKVCNKEEARRLRARGGRSASERRLAAASAETERMRVVVQCQDGGADDV